MTARTAEELDIRQQELDALVWVRDQIVLGSIVHHDSPIRAELGDINMACDYDGSSCGTVACIAGWMALHMYAPAESERERVVNRYMYWGPTGLLHSPDLEPLFFPSGSSTGWRGISAEQIVRTITNFLATGIVNWRVTEETMLHD